MNRIVSLCFLFLGLAAPQLSGAQNECPTATDDQVLSVYLSEYATCVWAGQELKEVQEKQAASPSSPSPGFATSLRSSIEDFLSVFNIAADNLIASDDDQALTLRLNPIRAGTIGSLGLSITATQPEVGEFLLNAVSETDRAAAKEVLTDGLDESDNLTFKASFGFERKASKHDRWLIGRNIKNYQSAVEAILPELSGVGFSTDEQRAAIDKCDEQGVLGLEEMRVDPNPEDGEGAVPEPADATIGQLKQALEESFAGCMEVWEDREKRTVEAAEEQQDLAWIPFLIDNQPQLIFSAEVQDRAEAVGRSGWNVNLSYEKGFNNFNTFLRRANGKDRQEWPAAFAETIKDLGTKEIEAENRITFSLTYAERDPYSFSRTIGEGDDAVSIALDLPRAKETCGKIEFHRNATWHRMKFGDQEVFPKIHGSLEYIDVSDDPMRRDRMVGVVTYEIPLPSGMNLPLSVSYANHAEFLGDVDEELSAHFGFSYKIPGK